MDSSWIKVRQLVAQRVLSRHLEDLNQQHLAADTAHRKHVRHVQQQLHAVQRNRTGSMQMMPSEPAIPTPRRRSLPLTPGTASHKAVTPTRHSHVTRRPDLADAEPGYYGEDFTKLSSSSAFGVVGVDRGGDATSNGGSPSLLDMMANTLHTAQAMEQERPSLYLQTPVAAKPPSQTTPWTSARAAKNRETLGPASNTRRGITKQVSTASVAADSFESAPKPLQLEKGETHVTTETSIQVLSLDAGAETPASASDGAVKDGAERISKMKATAGRRQESGIGRRKETYTENIVDVAEFMLPQRRRGSVNVEFYQEGSKLGKGSSAAQDPSLPLDMLVEEEEEEHDDQDDGEEDETEEEIEMEKDEGPGKDVWSEVKKCHYIRGYDPPEMRMPNDMLQFVFDDSMN